MDIHPKGSLDQEPKAVAFLPRANSLLPVEVVDRTELRSRIAPAELLSPQRADFHQLIICTDGHGTHHVDFEPVEIRPGTLLRVYPGQVQRFQFEPEFNAHIIVFRSDLTNELLPDYNWFPGSDLPTRWSLEPHQSAVIQPGVEELRNEQANFDGSPAYVVLMESLLSALLARLVLLVGETLPSRLPTAYVDFRLYLESNLRARPRITKCASDLGYSTRTIDRACQAATGQTAKQVLDDRLALEIRRRLTYTDDPVANIGTDFNFIDASSFSKFVRRHFDMSPTELRAAAFRP